jgi:type VI secretion system protein ImpL
MKARKFSGYWIFVGSVTVGMAVFAYLKGSAIDPSPLTRVIGVLLIGAALLLARGGLTAAWRYAASRSPGRNAGKYERDPAAKVGAPKPVEIDLLSQRVSRFKLSMQQAYGWRWRYQQPWLLVTGDQATAETLSPGISTTGWAVTPEMVLFYVGTADQSDENWLKRIRGIRPRRPVDATVQVVRLSDANDESFESDALAHRLFSQSRSLGWAAPAYLLNVVNVDGAAPQSVEAVACTWSSRTATAERSIFAFTTLSRELAEAGTQTLERDRADRYRARLSQHIEAHAAALSALVLKLNCARSRKTSVVGVFFAPLFKQKPVDAANATRGTSALAQPTWQAIAAHSRTVHGRRVGFSLSRVAEWSAIALAAIWIVGTLVSTVANRSPIQTASTTIIKLAAPRDATQAALNLDTLQKQIGTLEARQRDGAPWYARFGLNRDAALLSAAWPAYETASSRILIQPVRTKLEADLRQLGSLTDQELASGGDAQVKGAYITLKSYLMLAEPQRADSNFLTPRLMATDQPARPEPSTLNPDNWHALTQRLVTFHANHLRQRPSLAITPDATLTSTARQTLVSVMGLQNSTDTVYQQILDETRVKYPPVSLQTLLGETSSRGVFTTSETVPGIYTRQAWDERIGKAIDDADEQRTVTGDWVLSDTPSATTSATASTASLKEQLRQRYFADYGRAWQQFLNSVRWQADTSLSGTVDQLSLYADPQRSPLSALFKVIVYQAGTGAVGQSLSDTLVNKARSLVTGGEKNKDPSTATSQPEAPLASAFGPLLRVAGSDLAANSPTKTAASQPANTSDISLPRYLERVTGVRLKLQQIMMSPDPDAMSRTAAQAILQGKTSDIGDSRDYASRVAASLGEQWSGFGNAVFQRPLDQTWDVVLQPATASLNETWRTAVVAAWNKSFGGRYPFADSDSDASLPEMARFLRVDGGVISQFVSTQLGGIIERQGDQWVVMQATGGNTLRVDPEFVSALNRLTRVSNVLFPTGDASLRYELRAIPTPGITDVKIALSGRDLHYFNQREEWTPFVWPGEALENGTRIEWQTEQAGARVAFDFAGRFGLIRLLERATVSQQDGARYLLRWPLGKEAVDALPEAMPQAHAVAVAVATASAPAASKRPALRENDDWAARTATSAAVPDAVWKPDESKAGRVSAQPLGLVKPRWLQVQLRSEVGAGPLDVLKLRHFTLPSRIFLRSDAGGRPINPGPNPPPLPVTAIEAAKRAATPLPRGALPDIE